MTPRDRILEGYLRRLRWGLSALTAAECDDILAETRTHINERVAGGARLTDVLGELGPAEAYARAFFDEREAVSALGSRRTGDMLAAVLRRTPGDLTAMLAFVAVLALATVTFVAAALIVLKLLDPQHTGLWISEHEKFIGVIDDPAKARELLGNGVFFAGAVAISFSWVCARAILALALRRFSRSLE